MLELQCPRELGRLATVCCAVTGPVFTAAAVARAAVDAFAFVFMPTVTPLLRGITSIARIGYLRELAVAHPVL